MNDAIILTLFAIFITLPFIAGIILLKKRNDSKPLNIDPQYSRDPQYFGQALRLKLKKLPKAIYKEHLALDLDRTSTPQIIENKVLGNANLHLEETYFLQGGLLGPRVHAKAICSDADLSIDQYFNIKKCIDVQGNLTLEAHSNLGTSAVATGQMNLQPQTQFRRLYGHPIVTHGSPTNSSGPPPSLGDHFMWARNALRIPKHQILSHGIVCHGSLYLGQDSVIQGDIKVYGDLMMYQGAQIHGNVVVRGSIIMYGENTVHGHVHTEKDLVIGPRSTLGRQDVQLSVYAAGKITLLPEVSILGYVVADRGGFITEEHPILKTSTTNTVALTR